MSDPTWFQWVAEVVAPTLLGLGAIAVGFASWSVARASHLLASNMAHSEKSAAARADRERVGLLVTDWAEAQWSNVLELPEGRTKAAQLRLRVGTELSMSTYAHSDLLHGLVIDLYRTWDAVSGAEQRARVGATFQATIEIASALWVNSPRRFVEDCERYLVLVDKVVAESDTDQGDSFVSDALGRIASWKAPA